MFRALSARLNWDLQVTWHCLGAGILSSPFLKYACENVG